MGVPIYGLYLRRVGHIPVNRRGGASTLKAMVRHARQETDKGRHLIIYPEGTRTNPGESPPYHPGIAALYSQLDLPVVPVALNSGMFWGRRAFVKRPGRMILEFLPPIPPGLPRRVFMDQLRERIETASKRLSDEAVGAGQVQSSTESCG
jgi:1-acyl-sn-glycerol-3-phosphate acyltransferase